MDDPGFPDERRGWRTDREWARLRERIALADSGRAPRRSRTLGLAWLAAASILVVAAGAGVVAIRGRRSPSVPIAREARTGPGERLIVRLSDSSTVTLGPSSFIHSESSQSLRRIRLEGLAQFQVLHDAARPLVVEAGAAQVRDIGTTFVVRAYPGDSAVQVAVTEGAASLANHAGPPGELTLHAGDVGLVPEMGKPIATHNVAAGSLATWVTGVLTFDDEPLPAVILELNRWFDVDLRIADATLSKRRVTAVYSDASLSSVLDALSATLGLRYTRDGRTFTLRVETR